MRKFLISFMLVISMASRADEYRAFTDKEGRSIKAKVLKVDVEANKVTMERDTKKETTVSIDVFSEADQIYIKEWMPAAEDYSHWEKMVGNGEALIHEKKPAEAIENYFDPVIKKFNSICSANSAQIYCARDSKETLVYLMQAAVMSEVEAEVGEKVPVIWGSRFAKQKKGAEVWSQFWAKAFFLKAYALVELGKLNAAKETLQTAVGLSPVNANYLSELGHIYQLEKDWDMALAAYQAAEDSISFSHPDIQDAERSRAWRGIGFVYIELGQLDKAKEKYMQCLEQNPNDQRAAAELKYIENLYAK
ncbi:tetratricopeptide repeat protein [Pontiellaceae bacterium B1224]|nr:tetratricopeptide repeat protein [Pontiellaceae bacterium B1224]